MGSDQRAAVRAKTQATVHVCYMTADGKREGDGRIADVSRTGMRFFTEYRVRAETRLVLKLHFPRSFHRLPLSIKATVVRCEPQENGPLFNVACRFDSQTGEATARLTQFVGWLLTHDPSPQ
ncbi:MAG: PilZ domain-containing protein [Elusimicrobia bacterium]|nr:PilZ domain-containing protein [Elusimicrobiota bacterium]